MKTECQYETCQADAVHVVTWTKYDDRQAEARCSRHTPACHRLLAPLPEPEQSENKTMYVNPDGTVCPGGDDCTGACLEASALFVDGYDDALDRTAHKAWRPGIRPEYDRGWAAGLVEMERRAWQDQDDEMNDPAYEAYCAEQDAVADGLATELTPCYLCEPDVNERVRNPKAGPLRGILRRSDSGGADPTEVLHLSCGHAII